MDIQAMKDELKEILGDNAITINRIISATISDMSSVTQTTSSLLEIGNYDIEFKLNGLIKPDQKINYIDCRLTKDLTLNEDGTARTKLILRIKVNGMTDFGISIIIANVLSTDIISHIGFQYERELLKYYAVLNKE